MNINAGGGWTPTITGIRGERPSVDQAGFTGLLGGVEVLNTVIAWMGANGPAVLVIHGGTGSGKTYLAETIAQGYYRSNPEEHPGSDLIVAGRTERAWLQDLDEDFKATSHRLASTELVLIDDFGIDYPDGAPTEVRNTWRGALDQRTGRWVITTELSSDDLTDVYGQAVASRIGQHGLSHVIGLGDTNRRTPDGTANLW